MVQQQLKKEKCRKKRKNTGKARSKTKNSKSSYPLHKKKFSIKDFFSKCKQIHINE